MGLTSRLILIVFVVLWTTIRHEGSHAAMALFEGAKIQAIRLFPGIHEELGFYFGYVQHNGNVSWLTDAAPFFADVIVLIPGLVLLNKISSQSRWFFYVFLFVVVSPLADLIYGYQSGLWRTGTDVADLLHQLPVWLVHLVFLTVIASGLLCLSMIHHKRPRE